MEITLCNSSLPWLNKVLLLLIMLQLCKQFASDIKV